MNNTRTSAADFPTARWRLIVRSLRGRAFVWIGIAVSIAAIALALRGLHIEDVARALRETNLIWLLPAVAALLLGLYPRVRRWHVLFYPRTDLKEANLFGSMNVGYMLNNLLPLRVGEFGRAFLIGRLEGVGYAQALSTILVERVLDVLVLFALLIALLPVVDEPRWATGSALVVGLGALGLAALLAAAGSFRRIVSGASSRLLRRAPPRTRMRAERWVDAALDGFATLSHPRVLAEALLWSILGWAFSSVFLLCCLIALDIHLGYAAPLLVMIAINLGMLIPSSSGYIGVYHAIVVETMTAAFAISREQAIAFAIISHALFYIVPILLGGAFLWNRRSLWSATLSNVLGVSDSAAAREGSPAPSEQV